MSHLNELVCFFFLWLSIIIFTLVFLIRFFLEINSMSSNMSLISLIDKLLLHSLSTLESQLLLLGLNFSYNIFVPMDTLRNRRRLRLLGGRSLFNNLMIVTLFQDRLDVLNFLRLRNGLLACYFTSMLTWGYRLYRGYLRFAIQLNWLRVREVMTRKLGCKDLSWLCYLVDRL